MLKFTTDGGVKAELWEGGGSNNDLCRRVNSPLAVRCCADICVSLAEEFDGCAFEGEPGIARFEGFAADGDAMLGEISKDGSCDGYTPAIGIR